MDLQMAGVDDLGKCACVVDVSRMCRGRRMIHEFRYPAGSARLVGAVIWLSGSTIPDGRSLGIDLPLWNWPSWMVPALIAAECVLTCKI